MLPIAAGAVLAATISCHDDRAIKSTLFEHSHPDNGCIFAIHKDNAGMHWVGLTRARCYDNALYFEVLDYEKAQRAPGISQTS